MNRITIDGREYVLTEKSVSAPVEADLKRRGWDGKTYFGQSVPKGRQRKLMTGLFYRAERTGEFELVCRLK